ncbi:MAG: hypothetical protein MJZ03_04805 [archaeon]|nr:hypothetical protein [archaeon]
MNNKYRIVYLDEEVGWQTTAYTALHDEFDMCIPESMPKSVKEVWSLINEFDAQAVILDYRLNDAGTVSYTGDDVVKEIRKHNEYLPVFIITSYEDDAILECKETQSIRGKYMIKDAINTLINMVKAGIGLYNQKKEEANRLLTSLQEKMDRKESLSECEIADKFDMELFLSKLDKDSSVRGNMIQSNTFAKLDEMISLAKEIVANYKKE